MKNFLYPEGTEAKMRSWASLILRITFGFTMLMNHGWGKMLKLFGEDPIQFADPIGVGPAASLALTVLAEVLCSALIMLGLFTRATLIPLIITMLVAIFIVHIADPFKNMEMAILYLAVYLAIYILGPGKYSLDHLIFNRSNEA